ncbi:AbiV family abortive infection protein [Streptomyces sp. LMG1-1-1.1]|uniref:AbiV family abortive infection protein n=1 Tax=Streptomyces sp. LMG1-1-1.1 TaxID=3135245 RepID=UPI003465AFB0
MTTLPSDPEMADRILIGIGREAFKHARDLLHAARLILDAEIWSVAYANAALALEEIGKAALCSAILPMPLAQRQAEVDAFPDRFTSHEAKSFSAHLVLRIAEEGATEGMEQIFKRAERDAKRTNKNKFRGLYVDYKNTGHLLRPGDITKAQASELISTVDRVLTLSADAEDAMGQPEIYLSFIRQLRDTYGSADVWQDLAEGMDEILPAISAIARDELSPQEALKATGLGALLDGLVPMQTVGPASDDQKEPV